MSTGPQPLAAVVDALRAQATALDLLADAIEAGGAGGDGRPDEHQQTGAFGAVEAAAYCGIGSTLLREQGPAPRFVGGRAVWTRADLDEWLAQLPTEPSHRRGRRSTTTPARGRRPSAHSSGGKAAI